MNGWVTDGWVMEGWVGGGKQTGLGLHGTAVGEQQGQERVGVAMVDAVVPTVEGPKRIRHRVGSSGRVRVRGKLLLRLLRRGKLLLLLRLLLGIRLLLQRRLLLVAILGLLGRPGRSWKTTEDQTTRIPYDRNNATYEGSSLPGDGEAVEFLGNQT